MRPVISFTSEERRPARDNGGWLVASKWIGTAAGVAGAVLIALNLGVVTFGLVLFLVSSLLWFAVGWVQREPSLLVLQGAFTAINMLGICRWAIF